MTTNTSKNIVLLGAPKSGKTLMAKTCSSRPASSTAEGTIEGKNTISDCHEIEQERGQFCFLRQCYTQNGAIINQYHRYTRLDDFAGEMISSLRVADTCVVAINAQHGAEVELI